jgi:hypothetical protein
MGPNLKDKKVFGCTRLYLGFISSSRTFVAIEGYCQLSSLVPSGPSSDPCQCSVKTLACPTAPACYSLTVVITMAVNVTVQTTREAVNEIWTRADGFLAGIRNQFRQEGVTETMVKYCREHAKPLILEFEGLNTKGVKEMTLVFEKQVKAASDSWRKECQISIEIDADKANENLGQTGHFGCEIYFANEQRSAGKTMDDPRAGDRLFKMHAFLPHDPPFYRHGSGKEERVVVFPGSELKEGGQTVLYRCKKVTIGPGELALREGHTA